MNQETIERAARVAYIEMEWPNRITEHDSNRKADGEYKERAAKLWDEGNAGWSHYHRYTRQAAAVIAAIHPTVDSDEELDALPVGSVIVDQQGRSWQAYVPKDMGYGVRQHRWMCPDGGFVRDKGFFGNLPATVLYTPGGAA